MIVCPRCSRTLKIKEKRNKIIIKKKCRCGVKIEKIGFRKLNYYGRDLAIIGGCNSHCKYFEKWRFNIAHVCEFCLHPKFIDREECPILEAEHDL